MATMKFEGVDDYLKELQKIYDMTDEHVGRAIYAGAKVVADGVKEAVRALPRDDDPGKKDMRSGLRSIQVEGLVQSFGISPMRTDGTFKNVKLGFDGYNAVRTERWPQGQPNAMIARAAESGTSFMKKTPFMSKTTRAKKAECEAKMRAAFDQEISRLVRK